MPAVEDAQAADVQAQLVAVPAAARSAELPPGIEVVTVAFSTPPRRIFARQGGSHSRTLQGIDARTPMNPITTEYFDA